MEPGTARTVTVDAQKVIGDIRSLQGAHWDPGAASGALSKHYVAMGVDMIRTHDAGGINGSGAGDVDGPGRSSMFPNLSADPSSEASYKFGPTDALIKNIRDANAEVYFRVGRSNISGSNTVPTDFDKYADVVKHIVMHYNQGWANGFQYGIKWFEIWNEPDFVPFWTGTGEQYHELYGKIAKAIRSVEPNALIGGPANSTFNDKMKTRGSLLKYIKDNQLPFDFYSFHKYTNKSQDPMDYARMAQSFRDELDMYGFTSAKIVNSEWETSLQGDVMLGGEAGHAAFLIDALIYMQNGPVDRSMSYMQIGTGDTKESLAFGAVSKLNATPSRLCAQGGDDNGFGVLAGMSKTEPLLQVLIANYQVAKSLMGPIPGGNDEELQAPGLGKLADMTYPDRRNFSYPDKDGYDLTIKSIPEAWGDVTVKQYRIDAGNSFKLVNMKTITAADRAQGGLNVPGKWARATPSADDPKGAAQGADLIVVSGASAGQ
jgi:xylan 1,4-beta-xylosidase